MSRSAHHKNARRAGLAVAGATAAALATGGAVTADAASNAPATTTGTIFACYSNTTKTLTHTTKTAGCKTGFTELSWNAKGPQGPQGAKGPQGATGPQGAPGPQGPPGAIADFTTFLTSPVVVRSSSPVIASVTPVSSGMYNVTATELAGRSAGVANWACVVVRQSAGGPPVSGFLAGSARTAASTFVDGAGTGAVFGGPRSPIELVCAGASASVHIVEAGMTATRVSSVNGVTGKPAHPRIFNHFTLRPGLPAAQHARSQAHH